MKFKNLREKIMQSMEKNIIIIGFIVKSGIEISVIMEKNYTLRGKWSHLGTKKHERNHFAANSLIKL